MSKELKDAAETCRAALIPGNPWSSGMDHAAWTIAKAYLAEHPASDDDQINGDDLLEEGFRAISLELTRFEHGPFRIDITGGCGGTCLFLNDMPICDDPTVGDVRRLFAALKIKE